jgi:hypothetical protein
MQETEIALVSVYSSITSLHGGPPFNVLDRHAYNLGIGPLLSHDTGASGWARGIWWSCSDHAYRVTPGICTVDQLRPTLPTEKGIRRSSA